MLDGKIDEAGWQAATPVTEFTQVDPVEGQPATERTEMRFLFDDGALYVGETATPFANLAPRLKEMAADTTRPIYVRADGKASYEIVARVMASLSTSGFTSINLITDTGGPSSGSREGADEAASP